MRVSKDRELIQLLSWGPRDDPDVIAAAEEALGSKDPLVVLAAAGFLRSAAAFDAAEALSRRAPNAALTVGLLRLFADSGETERFLRLVGSRTVARSTDAQSELVELLGPSLPDDDRSRILATILKNPFATAETKSKALSKLMPSLTPDRANRLFETLLEGSYHASAVFDALLWGALDELDEGTQEEWLTQLVASSDVELRTVAYGHIERLAVRTTLPALIPRLDEEKDAYALRALLLALHRVGDGQIEPRLLALAQRAPASLRAEVVRLLGEVGTSRSVPVLSEMRRQEDTTRQLRQALDEATERIGERASERRGALTLSRLDRGQLSLARSGGGDLALSDANGDPSAPSERED